MPQPLNRDVKQESDCTLCMHEPVCKQDMEKCCYNYEFGTSKGMFNTGHPICANCLHCITRFTRKPEDKRNCFDCNFFLEPHVV